MDTDRLDWTTEGYDYELPEERIAQNPVTPRDQSRLLIVDSLTSHHHRIFRDLPHWLKSGDLLVFNNTQVIPARLYGSKSSGASVEILLLEERQPNCWLALVKPGKRFKIGVRVEFEPINSTAGDLEPLSATVVDTDEATGGRLLKFDVPAGQSLIEQLEHFGHIPFPPYVTESEALPQQYQTIYAKRPGAVAAPTAGLHFTEELFQQLEHRGINKAFVTLHVGVGTFRPVEVTDITTHQMHAEWIEVSPETVEQIQKTKAKGGRVIAVGTTVVRTLEGVAMAEGKLTPYCGKTNAFIYPGYQFQAIDGLITNFHLPRSSLMMLVAALIGRQRLLDLYQDAIAQSAEGFNHPYRFYSFGDAMLILPGSVISVTSHQSPVTS
ncbi:tRNA preQ1(34) S-adenosylmethionine ribosyltransferase-isomerase QueA [Capilliphycus salinus ALCB114379]|uniref:tRNA preQ1(34) S-adenosylmethionine ribosyltransferase-isomerase QueA n=1 Tax=Capilliphycus salinus TaxID=2768948 RepID=UPI0039A73A69